MEESTRVILAIGQNHTRKISRLWTLYHRSEADMVDFMHAQPQLQKRLD